MASPFNRPRMGEGIGEWESTLEHPDIQTAGDLPPGTIEIFPGMWRVFVPDTNQYAYFKEILNALGKPTGRYEPVDIVDADGAGSAETARHNRATEAAALRGHALDTAAKALSGYLDATRDIAERRRGALSEARELLPFLVSPDQKYFSGFEPGGLMGQFGSEFGLNIPPSQIQHKQLQPGLIAQEGPISPEVAAMLEGIRGA